ADVLLEILPTESLLCLSLFDVRIGLVDLGCDIVDMVLHRLRVNLRDDIALLYEPARFGDIDQDQGAVSVRTSHHGSGHGGEVLGAGGTSQPQDSLDRAACYLGGTDTGTLSGSLLRPRLGGELIGRPGAPCD